MPARLISAVGMAAFARIDSAGQLFVTILGVLRWSALIPVVAALGSVLSCTTAERTGPEWNVLEPEYRLLLVAVRPADLKLASGAVQHLSPASSPGQLFARDRVYVFEKVTDADNEGLAVRTLPGRLRSIGSTIVRAPKSQEDFVERILGGPLFRIRFDLRGLHGVAFNQGFNNRNDQTKEQLIVAFE